MDINKTDKEKLKWFFKRYIYTGKKYLVLIIVLIFIGSLVANISPYLYGKMLDSITLGDMDLLFKIIIIY
jgi:ATP-binding cassette subfamily B protein